MSIKWGGGNIRHKYEWTTFYLAFYLQRATATTLQKLSSNHCMHALQPPSTCRQREFSTLVTDRDALFDEHVTCKAVHCSGKTVGRVTYRAIFILRTQLPLHVQRQ